MNIDEEGLLIDENMTLAEGAIAHWGAKRQQLVLTAYRSLAQNINLPGQTHQKFAREVLDKIFYGSGKDTILVEYESNVSGRQSLPPDGKASFPIFAALRETNSPAIRHEIATFMKGVLVRLPRRAFASGESGGDH